MRAWIELDDDLIPIMSVENKIDGKIVEGRYFIWYPVKWTLEIGEMPDE